MKPPGHRWPTRARASPGTDWWPIGASMTPTSPARPSSTSPTTPARARATTMPPSSWGYARRPTCPVIRTAASPEITSTPTSKATPWSIPLPTAPPTTILMLESSSRSRAGSASGPTAMTNPGYPNAAKITWAGSCGEPAATVRRASPCAIPVARTILPRSILPATTTADPGTSWLRPTPATAIPRRRSIFTAPTQARPTRH